MRPNTWVWGQTFEAKAEAKILDIKFIFVIPSNTSNVKQKCIEHMYIKKQKSEKRYMNNANSIRVII